MNKTLAEVFGNAVQTSSQLIINKSSWTNLFTSSNNSVESILLAIIQKALLVCTQSAQLNEETPIAISYQEQGIKNNPNNSSQLELLDTYLISLKLNTPIKEDINLNNL